MRTLISTIAAIVLSAVVFTSCSSDDGDENEGGTSSGLEGGSSSSSDGTEPSSSSGESSSSGGETANGVCSDIEYGDNSFTCGRQEYKTVVIGEKTWMAENLNYETPSGSYCYENQESNCDTYGRLYKWDAAIDACTDGWHLPDNDDWEELLRFVDGSTGIISSSIYQSTIGGKLKATGTDLWNAPNTGAANAHEFSALPGGHYDGSVYFGIKSVGYWWSATSSTSDILAYGYYMQSGYDSVNSFLESKSNRYSVRCVKND